VGRYREGVAFPLPDILNTTGYSLLVLNGMKRSAHKRTGARIGKLPGREGWYVIWFASREKRRVFHLDADPAHQLVLEPATNRGLRVTATPSVDSPFRTFIDQDDIILNVGTHKINSLADFNVALKDQRGMHIGVLVNKGGKTGGIMCVEKAGDNRDIAETYFARWLQNRDRLQAGLKPVPEKIRFSDLAAMFLKWAETPSAGYSPNWLRGTQYCMRQHVARWGHLNLDEITTALLSTWFDEYSHTVAPSTAANAVKPLRKCFQLAIQRGYTADNPASILKIHQPRQATPKYLSRDNIALLIECAKILDAQRLQPRHSCKGGAPVMPGNPSVMKRYYNADDTYDAARIRFLLLSALRKSQLTSLTWQHYDPARGTLTLESSAEHTEKSRRVTVIPLPDEARRILEAQPQNSRYIFPNLRGGRDNQIALRFARIAKLVQSRGGGHISLHILRHTALTYLLEATGDIAAVQAYAGHADVRMTQRYAHILPSKLAALTKTFSIMSTPLVPAS
jgi:integrase